jgi:hypothetical protein
LLAATVGGCICDGQDIFIFPTQQPVVVVLGFSLMPDNVIDFNALLRDILEVKSKE